MFAEELDFDGASARLSRRADADDEE
jgi:hypothetical protein